MLTMWVKVRAPLKVDECGRDWCERSDHARDGVLAQEKAAEVEGDKS